MNLSDLKTMKENYLKEMKEKGESLLKQAFVEFFEKSPMVKAIKFRAYTPYFNDGDICEFSVHDFYFGFEGAEGGDYEDGFHTTWDIKRNDQYLDGFFVDKPWRFEVAERAKQFNKDVVDNELFQIIFGDHVEVTATREGFTIEECEHD